MSQSVSVKELKESGAVKRVVTSNQRKREKVRQKKAELGRVVHEKVYEEIFGNNRIDADSHRFLFPGAVNMTADPPLLNQVLCYDPQEDDYDYVGAFVRISDHEVLVPYHVVEDMLEFGEPALKPEQMVGRDFSFRVNIPSDFMLNDKVVGVERAGGRVMTTIVHADKHGDRVLLDVKYPGVLACPVTPYVELAGPVTATLTVSWRTHEVKLFRLNSLYWTCQDCPLKPGCSGIPATVDGKAIAMFVGNQVGGVGVFVSTDLKTDFAMVELCKVIGEMKPFGRKKRFSVVRSGQVSDEEYDYVVANLRSMLGRPPEGHEVDKELQMYVKFRDEEFVSDAEEEDDEYFSRSASDRGRDSVSDFGAEEGDFFENDQADMEQEARDVMLGREIAGVYYQPMGKGKKKAHPIREGDKVVFGPTSETVAEAAADVARALLSPGEEEQKRPETPFNPFESLTDSDVERMMNAGTPEVVESDPTPEVRVAMAKTSPNPFDIDADEQPPVPEVVKQASPRVDPADWLKDPVFRVEQELLEKAAKEHDAPTISAETRRLMAHLTQLPDTKQMSALRRREEITALREKIDSFHKKGIYLEDVVTLTKYEEEKYPHQEHEKMCLQKEVKALRDRENYLERKRLERENAAKTIMRVQDVLAAKLREVSALRDKLEELQSQHDPRDAKQRTDFC